LRLCHVNCQSLLSHFTEFWEFFLQESLDLIAMSETWLEPHIPDCFVELPGYQLFGLDRTSVAQCFVCVGTFLLAVVYRPRKFGHLSIFHDNFEVLLPSFSAAVVIGDFNINLNRSFFDVDFLLDFCCHLFLVPFGDTYFTSTSHSCIDHCLISD
ncbi:hypothetical protein ALC57_08542, partial [Trachymyrmex cornetzi]